MQRPYEPTPSSSIEASRDLKSAANCGAECCGSSTVSSCGLSCSRTASGTCACVSARSVSLLTASCLYETFELVLQLTSSYDRREKVRWKAVPFSAFSCAVVPTACSRPLCKIAMRSPRASASSRKWVVRTRARPGFVDDMTSHTVRRDLGSMPAVGSSSRTNLGSPKSAHASDNLRFWPPERVPVFVLCFASSRPTESSISDRQDELSRASDMPFCAPTRARFSERVRPSKMRSCCGHTPDTLRTLLISVRTEWPKIIASPSDGRRRPVRMPIVVVLPAPFCPSSAVIWPS
mmetsp:Transcript_3199/g.5391  ORF Transcript_3199/g.5391 Transcript_3199/m.5391 type:complete len:292 (+) Transcript_3199:495-1370(+)